VSSAERKVPPIGRIEVWDLLLRRRERARSGAGGLTLLEGTEGVGKSAFLDAIVDDSRRHGFEVFPGRAPPLENPPPFLVLQEALVPPESGPPAAAAMASIFAMIDGVGDAGSALGLVPREASPDARPPLAARFLSSAESPSQRASSDRQQMYEAFAEPLRQAVQRRPTLLALDDAHFADAATLGFLSYLVPRLAEQRLWVLITTLPLDRAPAGFSTVAEEWARAGLAERVTLRPLSQRELPEFVRWLDPRRTTLPAELSRWFEASGGLPVLLEQLVNARTRPAVGRPSAIEVRHEPSTPRDVLGDLAEPELRLLTIASVIGREVPFELLGPAIGMEEEALAELVERLTDQGLLREKPNERFEFVREDVRFELYSRLTGPRLRILHRRVAEALEARGPPDLASTFALARHFYLGRVDGKSVEYNRRAAEIARRSHSSQVALVHWEQALDAHRRALPEDLAGELELVVEIAIERDHVGELARAEEILREILARPALAELPDPDRATLARLLLARVFADEGRWDLADRSIREALPGVDVAKDPLLKMYALRLRGEIAFYRADYDQALGFHEAALRAAESAHNEREVAIENVRVANVLSMLPGRADAALPRFRQAREKLQALGDSAEAAYAGLCLGVVLSQHGRTDEGLAELATARELAERAHDLRRLGWVEFNIADLERTRQRLAEAEQHNQRARELLQGIGDRFGLGQTYLNEGKLRLLAGEPDLALAALDEAARLFREERLPGDEVEVVLWRGEVELERGRLPAAREALADLRSRDLVRLRPDLGEDARRFERRLTERETGGATSPTPS
jgi:tetratricopeptide (TPR) repeat protein